VELPPPSAKSVPHVHEFRSQSGHMETILSETAASERGGFDSLPPLSISPTIFWFLKSVILKTVGKELGDVPPTFGWDLVVFEPKTEQIMSKGGSFESSSKGMDEPFLNLDLVVEDCEDNDGDRSDSVVEVLQSQPVQITKPNEQGTIRHIKTTVSRPVSSPVRRPRTLYPKTSSRFAPKSTRSRSTHKKEGA